MQKQFMGVAALGAALAIGDASHAQAVQWKVSDGGNGHWYQFLSDPQISWSASRSASQVVGGDLATLTSAAENQFVFGLLAGASGAWSLDQYGPFVGGTRRQSPDWTWVSGEPWMYSAWGPGEPNNDSGGSGPEDCLALLRHPNAPQTWNDVTVSGCGGSSCVGRTSSGYLIEWSADCNNDGIVDYGQCRDGSLPDYNGNNVPDCCEQGTPCVVGNYPFQWRVGEGGNGHWYALYPCTTGLSAQAIADAVRGRLVSITSAIENEFVRRQVVASGRQFAMLGLVQADNQSSPSVGWAWTSGEALSYVNWTDFGGAYGFVAPDDRPCAGQTPQEDNQCNQGLMYAVDGSWDDIERGPSCAGFASSSVALVEFDTDCNRDGIVDKGQILTGQLADSDNDGVPNVCECICDVFRDFNVNGIDLGILLGQWGAGNQFTVTDFNNDGVVDGIDLGQLLAAWGPCPN
jgi:hypothetical protein